MGVRVLEEQLCSTAEGTGEKRCARGVPSTQCEAYDSEPSRSAAPECPSARRRCVCTTATMAAATNSTANTTAAAMKPTLPVLAAALPPPPELDPARFVLPALPGDAVVLLPPIARIATWPAGEDCAMSMAYPGSRQTNTPVFDA